MLGQLDEGLLQHDARDLASISQPVKLFIFSLRNRSRIWEESGGKMFFILFFVIYATGRALGWMVVSLAGGREALFNDPVLQPVFSYGWLVVASVLAWVLAFSRLDWGFALPF